MLLANIYLLTYSKLFNYAFHLLYIPRETRIVLRYKLCGYITQTNYPLRL